jgi:hypothetical protein
MISLELYGAEILCSAYEMVGIELRIIRPIPRCRSVVPYSDRLCVAFLRTRLQMRAATVVPSCMCGFVRRDGGRKRAVYIQRSTGNKPRAKLN